jgi:uncharacterized protein YbaP (TraB family)
MNATILLLTSLVLLPLTLRAQDEKAKETDFSQLKHPVQPVLWKIEGNGLKDPSYLFGTIHLGDPRVTKLHPKAEKAFEAADRFYGEIDLNPAKQIALMALFVRKDGKTLSEAIGPDLSKKVKAELKAIHPAFGSQPFEPMKTWVVAIQLPTLGLQLSGKQPLDAVLFERARKDEKKVGGLETAESQLKIFDDLSEMEQTAILKSTLEFLAAERKEGTNSMEKLLEHYLSGNVPELGKFMKEMMRKTNKADEELTNRLMKKLLDDRNVTLAASMAEALQKFPNHRHFFAVGAGHSVGETAIQDLLAKKGYTVTSLFE